MSAFDSVASAAHCRSGKVQHAEQIAVKLQPALFSAAAVTRKNNHFVNELTDCVSSRRRLVA
ncbi:hypothetical protein [Sandarakinorhabdus sp. DWP1-3-1]|uniref:hypothetical protein n=1 Tax=Sandarakinorhabdus sp. DWP1-3-1 TaxID=2804627 RepID=UPI003CF86B02